jgi:hypothetical protein
MAIDSYRLMLDGREIELSEEDLQAVGEELRAWGANNSGGVEMRPGLAGVAEMVERLVRAGCNLPWKMLEYREARGPARFSYSLSECNL